MVFAYEPEAAAVFTQYDFLRNENFTQFSYLVVDCGGGTVDIAAQKVTKQDGNIVIDYIAPPHGGNCGSFAVNDQFEKLLINILKISSENFKLLKVNCAVQWNKLMNEEFEESKINLNDKFSTITLQMPLKICKEINKITGKPFEDLIDEYGDENIEWDEDDCGIILNYPIIDQLFKSVLDEICVLIKTVLAKEECNEIKTILLVGGFAESVHLFQRIKDTFGNKYCVERSSTPTSSVVKGAVLCGQQQRLKTKHLPFVLSRKMKYTIGFEVVEEFQNGYHDIKRLVVINKKQYCASIFHTLVKANETIYPGSPEHVYKFSPASEEQTCIINIFSSSNENVRYVDEEGCQHKTKVEINLPSCDGDLSWEVELCVNFFNIYIEITAYSVIDSENKTRVTVGYEFA